MDRNVIERYRLSLFGRMVMGVAHEVDNHLSVVLGFSELIQLAAGKEQKVRDGAGKILSAGEKIGAIVQHFSRYVRPHAPSPEPFVPDEMIHEVLLFSRYDLGRDNVTVLTPQEIPPGILHADRRDFGLALLALLFNAAEAMSENCRRGCRSAPPGGNSP
jgi:C4-dicarboxylate-specific signal transduction histidine kinase